MSGKAVGDDVVCSDCGHTRGSHAGHGCYAVLADGKQCPCARSERTLLEFTTAERNVRGLEETDGFAGRMPDVVVTNNGTTYQKINDPRSHMNFGTNAARTKEAEDAAVHPAHYKSHPSGVECITIIQHMPFNVGTAVKYCWRAGLKGSTVEDLKKAIRYLEYEIERLST